MRVKRLAWLPLLLILCLLAACDDKGKSGKVEMDSGSAGLEGAWQVDYIDSVAANLDKGGENALSAINDSLAYFINFDLQAGMLFGSGLDGDCLLPLGDVKNDGNRYTLLSGGKTYEVEVLGNGRALFHYKGLALVLERPWTNPGDRELRGLAGAWKVETSTLPELKDGSFVLLTRDPEMMIYFDRGFQRAWARPYRAPAGDFEGFAVYLEEGFCLATVRDEETIEFKNIKGAGLVLKKHLLDSGNERLNGLWEVSLEDTLSRIAEVDEDLLERIAETYVYASASFPGVLSISIIERGERAPDGLKKLDFPLEVTGEGVFEARFNSNSVIRLRLLENGLLLVSEVNGNGDEAREKEICLLRRAGINK